MAVEVLKILEFCFFCELVVKWSEVVAEQVFKFIEPIFVSSERRDLGVQKFVIRVPSLLSTRQRGDYVDDIFILLCRMRCLRVFGPSISVGK